MSAAEVLAGDESFFEALLAGDLDTLREVLTDDFLIVDVLGGQVATRAELLGAMAAGELRFVEVTRHPDEASVRVRGSAAVVIGRTGMRMSFRGDEASVRSRYTHVFVRDDSRWRLLSAQGTRIAE